MTTSDNTPVHSTLSPSKAYQWTVCTASIPFIAANRHRIPPDRPGPAAVEGTRAHHVAESCLLGTPTPGYATAEMIEFGQAYAAYCRSFTNGHYEWGVERRVPLFYLPSERGTVDFFSYNREGIHVVDYKFGFDPVTSEENKQLAIYARSLVEDNLMLWDVDNDTHVTIAIFQPRLSLEPEVWTTTWGRLVQFTDDNVAPAAKLILGGSGTRFAPSERVCKRCPAKAICEAHANWIEKEAAEEVFAAIDQKTALPPVRDLTDERLVWIKRHRHLIDNWLDAIDEHLDARALNGEEFKGLKVVLSKGGNRQWIDEKKAARYLKKQGVTNLWTKDLISPAQALKQKKGLDLDQLVTRKPGVPVVVDENDKGEPVSLDRLKDFADIQFDNSEK